MTSEFIRNNGSQGWPWAKRLQEGLGLWAERQRKQEARITFWVTLPCSHVVKSPGRDGFVFEGHQLGWFSLIEITTVVSPKSTGGFRT